MFYSEAAQIHVPFSIVFTPDLAMLWGGGGYDGGQGVGAAEIEVTVLLTEIWAASVAEFCQVLSALDPVLSCRVE